MSGLNEININPNKNNIYELLYINTSGFIYQIKKNLWIDSANPSKFEADGDNSILLNSSLIFSKITQLNTGEFLFLGKDCNVYKTDYNLKNPVIVSEKQFTSLTQLSNYKILLTSKDGKMYTVDDINNFDLTTFLFFDDGTTYSSVKQTANGYIVAIDKEQCGSSWRFELINDKLMNKTIINLDLAFPDRITIFTPDQKFLINLNCNARHQNRIYKYDYSDRIIKSSFDMRCDEDEVYESLTNKCYKKCDEGYYSNQGDIITCWESCDDDKIDDGAFCRDRCKVGYKDVGGVCWVDQAISYDRGAGIAPDSCDDFKDDLKKKGFTETEANNAVTLVSGNCIIKPEYLEKFFNNDPDYRRYKNYRMGEGNFTDYYNKESHSYLKSRKDVHQDNSACNDLTNVVIGAGSCTGWDKCIKQSLPFARTCTYTLSSPGCSEANCGCRTWSQKCCDRGLKTRIYSPYGNYWSYSPGCSADNCGGWYCSAAYCCDDGHKWQVTGANGKECGTYTECIGGAVTRGSPRTCKNDNDGTEYEFAPADIGKAGPCYAKHCREGYDQRPGDFAICWNKNPPTLPIPVGAKKRAGCRNNRQLEDSLCYVKCDEGYEKRSADGTITDKRFGYEGNVTNCLIPANVASYIPISVAKKSKSRGNGVDVNIPTLIPCGKCCKFDLAFYNPFFVKPSTLNLPEIPITDGLVGYYNADSFRNGIWYDLSQYNNNAVSIKGTFNYNDKYITGKTDSKILFPYQILPNKYTVFNVSKYLDNTINTGRILSGYGSNWYSGFNNGLSGVSGRNKPITQNTYSAFDNNWVFSTDTNNSYRANSTEYTINVFEDQTEHIQLSVNLNEDVKNNSDFVIACVIVFNRNLSNNEIIQVEKWLQNTYSELYSTTYTKTFAEEGYNCYKGLIGKVTNDYKNYSYATYGDKPISCNFINLPIKKDFNPLLCITDEEYSYEIKENFDNLTNYFITDYIFYLLIALFFIIMFNKKKL